MRGRSGRGRLVSTLNISVSTASSNEQGGIYSFEDIWVQRVDLMAEEMLEKVASSESIEIKWICVAGTGDHILPSIM
jgi:hypothetical protein